MQEEQSKYIAHTTEFFSYIKNINHPMGRLWKDTPKTKEKSNKWAQLGLLFLGTSFFGNGTLGITKAILSSVLSSIGLSGTEIGLISGARGFKAIADIPAGLISDKYGRKKAAYVGQFLLIIAHWLMGMGNSFWSFFIARTIHGAGSGFNAGAATFGAADQGHLMKILFDSDILI